MDRLQDHSDLERKGGAGYLRGPRDTATRAGLDPALPPQLAIESYDFMVPGSRCGKKSRSLALRDRESSGPVRHRRRHGS